MTHPFKKTLFISLAQIVFASSALAYNVIQLKVTDQDLLNYKAKPEKYVFSEAYFKLNNSEVFKVEDLETRGQGSIGYSRKNFGLKLSDSIQLGRLKAKKIDLLSMSADAGYISTRLGLMTAELLKIGTPLLTEYAELYINGKSNGLYTVVEKPKSAFSKDSPYVVRRGYKSAFQHYEADVSKKLTQTEIQKIRATADSIYQDIATKKDEALMNSLKQKMDIEAYLRWMAMNSLYTNGDFPDEIFFYVDGEMYKQGRIYFRVSPWDFDDLFKSSMHNVPINERERLNPANVNSILYSYEDKLDRAFAPSNAYMYEQFKTVAKQVIINDLPKSVTDGLLTKIGSEIKEYLKSQDILQMSGKDSGRKGVAYTAKEIEALFYKRSQQIEARRAVLLERLK